MWSIYWKWYAWRELSFQALWWHFHRCASEPASVWFDPAAKIKSSLNQIQRGFIPNFPHLLNFSMNISCSGIDFTQELVNIFLVLFCLFCWHNFLTKQIRSLCKLQRHLTNVETLQTRGQRIEYFGQCAGFSWPMQTATVERRRMNFHQTEDNAVALIWILNPQFQQTFIGHRQKFGQIDVWSIKQIFQFLQSHSTQQVEYIRNVCRSTKSNNTWKNHFSENKIKQNEMNKSYFGSSGNAVGTNSSMVS